MLSESDLAALKARHPLREFIENSVSGIEFRKISSYAAKARCPFHQEKTSSFMVDSRDHHYYCFGCGASGDVIKFVQETQGFSFLEAVDQLNGGQATTARFAQPGPPPDPDTKARRMTDGRWQLWEQACDLLAESPSQIERIAQWRGFSAEIIRSAARHRLMGLWSYWGALREAFLISAPAHCVEGGEGYDPVPVSFHTRLAPQTPGNGGPKQSWHYDPKSTDTAPVKAWPFLWGDPNHALWIFVLEGQWDALALADACGWTSPELLPVQTAVVGIRGAENAGRFLADFALNPKAIVVVINDADTAGDLWHKEGGFLDKLRGRVREVISYRPAASGCKDVNDLHKAGKLDGAAFVALIQQRLQHPASAGTARPTFLAWCRAQAGREDETGRAARYVLSDKGRPKRRVPLENWRSHWRSMAIAPDLFTALDAALQEWISGDYTLEDNQ
jgi:CHC2 zinc finger